jgi:predicted DNA-binding ribbon-helix-helix protein
MPPDDGPSLEEACLWADLAEIAEERDTARRELAEALAEIRTLRAQLAAPTGLAA